jgi:hypothetical protein
MPRPSSTHRSSVSLCLFTALSVIAALLLGFAPATAASTPDSSLKAIVPMKSQISELRMGPDGKPLKASAKAVGDSSGPLGSSDLMGTPASKTILRSGDQIFQTSNVGDVGKGNETTAGASATNAGMTAFTDTPEQTETGWRATIDHQYPSVHGHFLAATRESVLEFKRGLAGSQSMYSLAATDAASQDFTYDTGLDDIDLTNGGTYVLKTGGTTAITNVSAGASAPAGDTAQLADLAANTATPAYAQQWAIVPANGKFQLVNRADGLCLAHTANDSSANVVTDQCDTTANNLWEIDEGGTSDRLWRIRTTSFGGVGLYSDGNSLNIGDAQAWEAHEVSEPGGSVPTWGESASIVLSNPAPYALAAGDLDGVVTEDSDSDSQAYHDEAVVAYTDSDGNWTMRVVDYNAQPGHLLVTAPDSSISFGQTGEVENGF